MREDSLRKLITFFFQYLWLVCALLIGINFASSLYTARIIMQNSMQEGLESLATEISHRIDVNYRLLESLKTLPQLNDTSIDVKDRAASLKPFAAAFDLWMIGVVDPDGMISSTLSYDSSRVTRDYIPRIMQTARREMSDIFAAGATGDPNFSQFVPVMRDNKVVSIIFTSMLLTDIDNLLKYREQSANGFYLLLDSKQKIISHPSQDELFQDLNDLTKREFFIGKANRDLFLQDLRTGSSSSFFSWYEKTLIYTVNMRIPNTQWTLVHRAHVFTTFYATLVGFAVQSVIYIIVFLGLHFLGTSYVAKKLTPVDNILKQVIDLNKVIHNTDTVNSEDAASILYISQKGLRDELTELPTRMLFRQVLNQRIRELQPATLCAIFYIDMDNLKSINDSFGHDYGDMAMVMMSKCLRNVAEQHDGLCARYGGDEFVLFVENLPDQKTATIIAQELKEYLRGSIAKGTEELSFYSSIGVALYPLHASSIDVVIQLADIALYEVKQNGKGDFAIYSPSPSKDTD